MKVRELMNAYNGMKFTNWVIHSIYKEEAIAEYFVDEHRHPDDGSYANPLYHINNEILDKKVESFIVSSQGLDKWDSVFIDVR